MYRKNQIAFKRWTSKPIWLHNVTFYPVRHLINACPNQWKNSLELKQVKE
jgi:hypothetical protein